MQNYFGRYRWITFLLAASVAGAHGGSASTQVSSRNLNPYHEQQLQDQIEKCASGVLVCSDIEMRCLKQQELCQLLMRAERYDEALQVAHNIYKTSEAEKERRAAHHYLLAEIYNRKMKASRTLDAMEKNRQYALSAAKEVVDQKYPSKWGVSEHARALIRQLSDSGSMGLVRQRVASRQGTGDSAKEAIAEAQREYLDATQGGVRSVSGRNPSTAKFMRVAPEQSYRAPSNSEMLPTAEASRPQTENLPSSSEVSRVLSPVQQYESGSTINASKRLNQSGLLTSQPGAPRATVKSSLGGRQPILVNGTAASSPTSVDTVVQNNLAQLLEAAKKRKQNAKSPYATGELPSSMR